LKNLGKGSLSPSLVGKQSVAQNLLAMNRSLRIQTRTRDCGEIGHLAFSEASRHYILLPYSLLLVKTYSDKLPTTVLASSLPVGYLNFSATLYLN
jgi:hypothetical protein